METTHRNPFAALAAFILGTLFVVGLAFAAYVAVSRGVVALPPAQMTVSGQQPGQRPIAPAPAMVPRLVPPQAQPAQSAPQVQPAPEPVYQPVGNDAPAPAEAAPAGAPMTDQYRETIQSQQRMNDKGEVCAPRSGCTKPGAAGPLPWPNGRP